MASPPPPLPLTPPAAAGVSCVEVIPASIPARKLSRAKFLSSSAALLPAIVIGPASEAEVSDPALLDLDHVSASAWGPFIKDVRARGVAQKDILIKGGCVSLD